MDLMKNHNKRQRLSDDDDDVTDGRSDTLAQDFRPWKYLPEDLLHTVFSLINSHTHLLQASMVCKRWQEASACDDLWKSLNFRNKNISPEQFENLSRRYSNATEVDIYGVPEVHLLATASLSSFKNLEALTLGEGLLGSSFFRALRDCSNLKSLSIVASTLGNGIEMEKVLISHDRLLDLSIVTSSINRYRLSLRCSQLKNLSLKHSKPKSQLSGLSYQLEILHLDAPCLESIELNRALIHEDASIKYPLLTSLIVDTCLEHDNYFLSATTFSCPLIESLTLRSCPLNIDESYFSPFPLHHLTSLYLSFTRLENLQPVFESCPQLKVLKLEGCTYTGDLSLAPLYRGGAPPSLRELDLSAGNISWFSIKEILALCTYLTHLSLSSISNMKDIDDEQFPQLFSPCNNGSSSCSMVESFIYNSSNHIRKVQIPSVSWFVHLSMLNLSECVILEEVDIGCLNICVLDLSNCPSLTFLKLKCPSLTNLYLQSANIDGQVLYAALSGCSSLKTLDIRFCRKIHKVNYTKLRSICPSLRRILWKRFCPAGHDHDHYRGNFTRYLEAS